MRMDVESPCVQSDPISDGPMQDKLVCLTPNKTTSEVLQLETRPRGRGDGCLQPGLVDCEGLRQSTMVPDSSLPVTGKTTDGKDGSNNPTMEFPAMVSNHPRSTGRPSSSPPSKNRPVILPTDQEFIMQQGVPDLDAWPISGNPSHHKDFLQWLQTSSYPPLELRPS